MVLPLIIAFLSPNILRHQDRGGGELRHIGICEDRLNSRYEGPVFHPSPTRLSQSLRQSSYFCPLGMVAFLRTAPLSSASVVPLPWSWRLPWLQPPAAKMAASKTTQIVTLQDLTPRISHLLPSGAMRISENPVHAQFVVP
jgi:hypothetical protein